MEDGNITLGVDLETRSITQSLKDLKRTVTDTFKSVSPDELSAGFKEVTAEIKRTEAEARKAQTALDKLMSGEKESAELKYLNSEVNKLEKNLDKAQIALNEILSGKKTPQSVKELEKALANLEKQENKMSLGYQKVLDNYNKYAQYLDYDPKSFPKEAAAAKNAQGALLHYEKEWDIISAKLEETRAKLDALRQNPALIPEVQEYARRIENLNNAIAGARDLELEVRQNPQLTEEAQKYNQQLIETQRKLDSLKEKQAEYERQLEQAAMTAKRSGKSMRDSFAGVERRITGLIKRVFFFSMITMGLRALRKSISALIKQDSELSSSLAQVKGNLAVAFGDIWLSVLPALRAMAKALAVVTNYLAQFISFLTGKSLQQGQQVFQSISDASENTANVGKAAKKAAKEAQRMLLPFDEMNVLSKDTAENLSADTGKTADTGIGIKYPTEFTDSIDKANAKLELMKDLVLAIGAAFLAWKLVGILGPLINVFRVTQGLAALTKGQMFIALTAIILGVALLVKGIRNLIKEGPNVNNVCDIIAGGFMVIGGAITLLTGATGLGLIVIAIGAVVLAFKHLYNTNKNFKKWVDSIIKLFKEKKFLEAGKMIITGILKGIKKALKSIGTWVKKHIFDPIVGAIKRVFGIESPAKEMEPYGENIGLGLRNSIANPFKGIKTWIKSHILIPIKQALFGSENSEGIFVKIGTKFIDTKEAITRRWQDLTTNIKDKKAEMRAVVSQKWADIQQSWFNLTSNIKDKVADMKARVATTWSSIKGAWGNVVNNVKDKTANMKARVATKWADIKRTWDNLVVNIKDKWANMKARVTTKWNDIRTSWTNLITNIKDKWASMKAKVATTWGDLRGTWNNLLSHFQDKTANIELNITTTVRSAKHFANTAIGYLNQRLGALQYPDGSWVFDTWDPIPYLAKGAVIPANKEFLAVLGDQKHGTNIEAPLQTIVDAFNTALAQNGGGTSDVNVYLMGDAKQIFKVVRTEANNYARSTGKAAFEL